MKIAMISRDSTCSIGGISTHMNGLIPELEKRGCEVEVFHGNGSATHTVNLPVSRRGDLKRFDLIHVQAPPYGPFIEALSVPFVVTVHSPLSEEMKFRHGWRKMKMRIWRMMEARTLKHAGAVIAVSQFTKDCLMKKSECEESKVTVIPNGVDLERYKPDKWEGEHLPIVMACSRNDARKNLPMTEEALEYVSDRAQVFRALGDVPPEEVEQMYRHADIFVTTSFSEGFNLTLLQGMASGCACVASDIPAHRELIADAWQGRFFSDCKEMKEQLDFLLKDSVSRGVYGRWARQRAEQYSWSKTAEMTMEVYKDVVQA